MPNILNNTTSLQEVLEALQNKAAGGGGEQATPVISVDNSTGLITATAGTKSATKQLAFQPAKTITPSATSQIAVSSGYYTGGNITVAAVPTQTKTATPKSAAQDIIPDSGKFLSKVTVNGDSNLVAGNIKSGVSIFGVNGTYEGTGGGSSGEAAEWSEAEDAMITGTLSTYTNDRVTSIGSYAFYNCTSLTSVSFPVCTSIGSNAFYSCKSLTSVSFPVCTSIGGDAFNLCTSLTSVSFPVCASIGGYAFNTCTSLTSVSFPVCTRIGSNAFYNCKSLTSVSFPVCTTISSYAFYNCRSLTSVSFPVCASIDRLAFQWCTSLTSVSFPVCTRIGLQAFYDCKSLTSAVFGTDLPSTNTTIKAYIYSGAFYLCSKLTNLTLYYPSVATLSDVNAFQNTPMSVSTLTGSYGSIYVPASLVAAYKSATNWATYADRITAIPELITFTIDGVSYQAEEGMTWSEWVESDYNTDGFRLEGSNVGVGATLDFTVVCVSSSLTVKASDAIIANHAYLLEY